MNSLDVPDALGLVAPAGPPADQATWLANKVETAVTVTIADIVKEAVTNTVTVLQTSNNVAKNLYKYIYHRYC
jgi:hypothetical protein